MSIPGPFWASAMEQPVLGRGKEYGSDGRTQLFVGNLPYRIRWQDLKDLFRKCGTVLRADVALTAENRSKGFGTVLYQSERDAAKAMETFHNFNWQGRVLDVRLDQQDPNGTMAMAMATAPQPMAPWMHQPFAPPMPHPMAQQPPFIVPNGLNLTTGHSISRPTSAASMRIRRSSSFSKPPSLENGALDAVAKSTTDPSSDIRHPSPPPEGQPGAAPPLYAIPTSAGPMYMPYGYSSAPPVHGGLMGFYHVPSRPPSSAPSTTYANRHLFVGNLPFNCQWQDLKDLFRSAGNILRADINVTPDGRSRGYGTVLFASEQDAIRAVDMFNGYDYHGRTLKVHFDKFAQSSAVVQGGSPSFQPSVLPHPNSYPPSGTNSNEEVLPHPLSRVAHADDPPPAQDDRAEVQDDKAEVPIERSMSHARASSATASNSQQSFASHLLNMHGRQGPGPLHFTAPQPQMEYSTGPAALMSPQPGGPVHNIFDPSSPQTNRVNMTPSMPGFSFHPFPQTPPLMPQFLSPGTGPFSPPLGMSSNQFNMAPGAPFHMPMGSPETPAFTSMLANGYFPRVEALSYGGASSAPQEEIHQDEVTDESAVELSPRLQQEEATVPDVSAKPVTLSGESTDADKAADARNLSDTYFPQTTQSSLSARRASTNSRIGLGPPPDIALPKEPAARSTNNSATRSDFALGAGLEVSVATMTLNDSSALSDEAENQVPQRRASHSANTSAPNSASATSNGFLDAGVPVSVRRASFEASGVQKPKGAAIEVGKSIWS